MSNDDVNVTTGLIHFNGSYVGSGVLFPWKEELHFITAGHNIYGKSFSEITQLSDWSVMDINNIFYKVNEISGDKDFAKEHDIVLLKLNCNSNSNASSFSTLKFCTIPQNPKHSLLFRGKSKLETSPMTHTQILYNNCLCPGSNKFYCSIERSKLTNDSFKSGSEWLGGWSGSGLFLANHKELICAGVLTEVPNKGNSGQLLFSNISALTKVGFEPEIIDSKSLDFDITFNVRAFNEIIQNAQQRSIEDWETEEGNSEKVKNLNRKLVRVYPQEKLLYQKTRIVQSLMVGDAYLLNELSKQEQLFELYKSSWGTYDLQDKIIYADSRSDARRELINLTIDYESFLDKCMEKYLSAAELKTLSKYGIYDWIAKCSLDFISDE